MDLGSVFILTSKSYGDPPEGAPFDENRIVGVYASRASAEDYRDNAEAPVEDGKIVEWEIHE